jgi:membrane-bound lytic murein transglycosylase B
MHAATLVLALGAAGPGLAQAPLLGASPPAPPRGVNAQLDALNARIDREAAAARLTATQALEAHRRVNAIQDVANTDREREGGKLSVGERLDLQSQIDHLSDDLHFERMSDGGTPPE